MTERHALVRALIDELPETGAVWPPSKRVLWLQAAAAVFDLVYGYDVEVVEINATATAELPDTEKQRDRGNVEIVREPEPSTIERDRQAVWVAPKVDVVVEKPAPSAPTEMARDVGGRPKSTGPVRPAGIPTNLNMAMDAIAHHEGKASASQIIAYVRRQYWAEAPSNWTASLYDQVAAKKLVRDGINFVRPIEPKIEEKPIATVAAATPDPLPSQVKRPILEGGVKFEFNGKSVMLTKTEFRVAEALRRAIGKGHLDYAYLMQAGTAGQQRRAGLSEKVWCMETIAGIRQMLTPLGLDIIHAPDFGYTMQASTAD